MSDPFSLHVFANAAEMNQAAASLLTTLAQEAVARHGRFSIALSGGGTPAGVYRLWGDRPFVAEMPWDNTHLFWGDERLVPPDDPGSNYAQVADLLLSNAPIPAENVHRARGELARATAVADYADRLTQFANNNDGRLFDVVLLGMGSDGHTASLFPGSPIESEKWVVGVEANYDGRPAQRISLTACLINQARHVIFLVAGAGKADMLQQVLFGPSRPRQLPAQRIQPTAGSLTWLTDEAAAHKLNHLTKIEEGQK